MGGLMIGLRKEHNSNSAVCIIINVVTHKLHGSVSPA